MQLIDFNVINSDVSRMLDQHIL